MFLLVRIIIFVFLIIMILDELDRLCLIFIVDFSCFVFVMFYILIGLLLNWWVIVYWGFLVMDMI